tara:strand:+ start:279 stop:1532 length:1254 start_codon:yes stop_codon:yes gene_type:complete
MKRQRWSWALYDWANSAFATTVMAGFFPVFFKNYWASDLIVTESTFWLGTANSFATVLIIFLSPFIGIWSDRVGMKKRLLFAFAALGITMTGSLFLVQQGFWPLALLLYIFAIIGFSSANVSYDAFFPLIIGDRSPENVSSLGYALGYLGGAILFSINIWMVIRPQDFGLSNNVQALKWSFLSVAIWWAIFSIPILVFVKEKSVKKAKIGETSWGKIISTWRELKALPMAFLFLISYWFYMDGVDTIIRMAVDYGLALGFETKSLMLALLITQLVGFPSALIFGFIGTSFGPKLGIWMAISIYVIVIFWAYKMETSGEFYILACLIGFIQGGIQALSRSLYIRLIPKEKIGGFFGLYNMIGRFAALLGPIMVGWIGVISGNPRSGILSILLLFAVAAFFFYKVDVKKGEKQAIEINS